MKNYIAAFAFPTPSLRAEKDDSAINLPQILSSGN